jgi:hypothetical protein
MHGRYWASLIIATLTPLNALVAAPVAVMLPNPPQRKQTPRMRRPRQVKLGDKMPFRAHFAKTEVSPDPQVRQRINDRAVATEQRTDD